MNFRTQSLTSSSTALAIPSLSPWWLGVIFIFLTSKDWGALELCTRPGLSSHSIYLYFPGDLTQFHGFNTNLSPEYQIQSIQLPVNLSGGWLKDLLNLRDLKLLASSPLQTSSSFLSLVAIFICGNSTHHFCLSPVFLSYPTSNPWGSFHSTIYVCPEIYVDT